MWYRFCFLISLIIICSCSSNKSIEGFDKHTWTNDPFGCQGTRLAQLPNLKEHQEELLSLNQNEVKQILGKPDEHELYQRTRKFFHYYLEPSYKCDSTLTVKPRILQIRFNALGLSNEVFVKNE